jgi:hypothetical protein
MSTAANLEPTPPPAADPFPFGWREIRRDLPGGGGAFNRQPLPQEDLLHPEPGDVMPPSQPHELDAGEAFGRAKAPVGPGTSPVWEVNDWRGRRSPSVLFLPPRAFPGRRRPPAGTRRSPGGGLARRPN